jgi:hypothetical protein
MLILASAELSMLEVKVIELCVEEVKEESLTFSEVARIDTPLKFQILSSTMKSTFLSFILKLENSSAGSSKNHSPA